MEQISKRPSIVVISEEEEKRKKRYQSKYTCYEKLKNACGSEETLRTYIECLKSYVKFCELQELEDLLEISTDDQFNSFTDYLIYLRKESKVSSSYINTNFSAIKKFYVSNNIKLDWEYVVQYKGKDKGRIIEDRTYTKEEIIQMLEHADLREKVIIYTLLSSGMRIGGLAGLLIKDLEYIEKYQLYKITVYSNDTEEKYVTFCTPECASIINKYLDFRKKEGNKITPESPLIHKKIMRMNINGKKGQVIVNQFDTPMTSSALQQTMTYLQRDSHVFEKESVVGKDQSTKSRIRKSVMRCHAFRKIFNTICIEQKVDHYVKEKLLGHRDSLKLDFHYFRPTDQQLLNEYLKVIDDLTINNENRISKQVQELKEKNEDKDYVIEGKLQEKESEIQIMKQQIQMLRESQKEILECLKYPERITRIINYEK